MYDEQNFNNNGDDFGNKSESEFNYSRDTIENTEYKSEEDSEVQKNPDIQDVVADLENDAFRQQYDRPVQSTPKEDVYTEPQTNVYEQQDNGTYRFTREQLENQWKPNTGAFGYEQNMSKKERKAREKERKAAQKQAAKAAAKQAKMMNKKPVTGEKMFAACTASALVSVLISSTVMYGLFTTEIKDKYALKTEMAASTIGSTATNLPLANTTSDSSARGEYSVRDVATAVMPSVVSITSTAIYESNMGFSFWGGGSYQVTGAGSGIIVGKNDTELLIVTNNHVVEGTTSLTVEFCNGTTVDEAYVKGTNSSNDVAIVGIKLENMDTETINAIKTAVLGDSNSIYVGDNVIAIGNALGYGQSVTAGVVSAVNREITLESGKMKVIQTDASINGGNSGGALVNMKGEVVGINVAKASSGGSSSEASVEGMGYAIPISQVTDIMDELMKREMKEEVAEEKKGYLGITNSSFVEVDETTSQMYNIPEGIYIREVIENSPLDKAGVVAEDVITAVDGQEIKTYEDLKGQMKYYAAGETVELTIKSRSGREYTDKKVKVTLVNYDELDKLIK